MHKKIIFLAFLALNSNNIFAESNTQELSFDEQLTLQKLQALKQQSKDIGESQDNIHSFRNVLANTTMVIAGIIVTRWAMNHAGANHNTDFQNFAYGCTCAAITGIVIGKDTWISGNLTAQQKDVTAAIANLQKPKN